MLSELQQDLEECFSLVDLRALQHLWTLVQTLAKNALRI